RTWNPVLPLVDALRARLSPRSARYVHWGTTSKNIIDTALALQIRDTYDVVLRETAAIESTLANLARRHRDTVMAGRTHGQHARPVTLGSKWAVWLDELLRQDERLRASRPRVLVGELGGAVGTMAALGRPGLRVQARLMKRLGLGVPRVPSKTAGDRFAEFFLLLGLLSGTLGKIAHNVYNLHPTAVAQPPALVQAHIATT